MPTVVDIGRSDVLQRLVYPPVVVILDELPDLFSQRLGFVIVLQLHHVFHCPMIPLDFALRLRVIRSAARMVHLLLVQVLA